MRRNLDRRTFATTLAAVTAIYAGVLAADRTAPSVARPAVREQVQVLPTVAARLERAAPAAPRAARTVLAPAPLEEAQAAVRAQVRGRAFAGAALAIGRADRTVVLEGIGKIGWTKSAPAVDAEKTVYDIASLTKVVATTTAVMLLHEDGRIDLDAPVSRYLPEFSGGAKDRVTIRHLLTHTSGLPAGADASGTPAEALRQLVRTPLERAPGEAVEYSDVGFIVLWEAAGRAAGEPLFPLLDRRVFGPLKMRRTTFVAGEDCPRCAPTRRDEAGRPVDGVVHDPTARKLGGIAGNAGLFSTAADLARFAAMLAAGGELDGVRVLKEETIRAFTERQPGAGTRALGWDTPGPGGSGGAGAKISAKSFGHTGFTGTSLWVDPERGTWTVLLSNRTYRPQGEPAPPNRMQSLRRRVNDNVAVAADEIGPLASLGE